MMPSIRATQSGTSLSGRPNVVAFLALLVPVAAGVLLTVSTGNPTWVIVSVVVGVIAAQSPRVASQWERAIVLRLGKYIGMRGPGLFWIVPFVDSVSAVIDQRVIT